MAAVALSAFTKNSRKEGGWETVKLVSPATMDSADTVDVTALIHGRRLHNIQAWDIDTTNGVNTVTATYVVGTDVITVDAAGGTTDSTYVITFDLLNVNA